MDVLRAKLHKTWMFVRASQDDLEAFLRGILHLAADFFATNYQRYKQASIWHLYQTKKPPMF